VLGPGTLATAVVVSLLVMGLGGWALHRDTTGADATPWCTSCHGDDGSLDSLAAGGHEEVDCAVCHEAQVPERARAGFARIMGANVPADHRAEARSSCSGCHVGPGATAEARMDGLAVHESHPGVRAFMGEEPREADDEVTLCTACHAAEAHAFAPGEEGCMAAGCHTEALVTLGAMAHESLACADCHALDATVESADSAFLRPTATECLACHAMQEVRPDAATSTDPHGNDCSACHQPHRQEDVSEARTTCATAGCHARPDTLVAAHRGMAPGVLQDCVTCHTPHQAQVEPENCVACHDETGGLRPGVHGPPPPGTPGAPSAAASLGAGGGLGLRGPLLLPGAILHAALPTAADTTFDARFLHEDHTTEGCVSCHAAAGGDHGELTVRTASDCRTCHHLDDGAPECAACHAGAEPGGVGLSRAVALELGVRPEPMLREIAFSHETHEAEDCATCHTPSLTRATDAAASDCRSCHVEHHEAAQQCSSCHVPAPDAEHPRERVHRGCGGAGCHTEVPGPIELRLRERATCVGCHQVQSADHYEATPDCASCHLLPPAHAGTPGAPPSGVGSLQSGG